MQSVSTVCCSSVQPDSRDVGRQQPAGGAAPPDRFQQFASPRIAAVGRSIHAAVCFLCRPLGSAAQWANRFNSAHDGVLIDVCTCLLLLIAGGSAVWSFYYHWF